jgi:hypothetical protein
LFAIPLRRWVNQTNELLVLQVEDYETNARFRQWATGQHGSTFWLLQNYFWSAKVSIGNFDGVYIESLIPGLGVFTLDVRKPCILVATMSHPSE